MTQNVVIYLQKRIQFLEGHLGGAEKQLKAMDRRLNESRIPMLEAKLQEQTIDLETQRALIAHLSDQVESLKNKP